MLEFERRAEKIAHRDALRSTAMKLVREMEEAIREADRDGAPEEEIGEVMERALEITRRIMDARRAKELTLEQEMERAFTRPQSGENQARNAS